MEKGTKNTHVHIISTVAILSALVVVSIIFFVWMGGFSVFANNDVKTLYVFPTQFDEK